MFTNFSTLHSTPALVYMGKKIKSKYFVGDGDVKCAKRNPSYSIILGKILDENVYNCRRENIFNATTMKLNKRKMCESFLVVR